MDIKPIVATHDTQNATSANASDKRKCDRNVADAVMENKPSASQEGSAELKAIFAIDDSKNVVVRLIDKNGKTVMQFPPEQLIKIAKELKLPVTNLFNKEV